MHYTEVENLATTITIADYLFHRLKQLKVSTIFGLPGEFNAPLIDKLYSIQGLRWAGNTNELNAAYAADGYARLKGLGCIISTFGVGELSAINGIAGSYAEHVGVLHVVGMPPTSAQTRQLLLHHTLGNGDYTVFHRMATEVSCHSAVIVDTDFCAQEVDACISKAFTLQRPVYMGIPVNLVDMPVESHRLNQPLDLSVPPNDPNKENEVVEQILSHFYKAKHPVIIADACVTRHAVDAETRELCERTQFPVFVTPMGKGAVDESLPQFGGVYTGSISSPSVREVVGFADFLIVIGCMLADFETSSFHFGYRAKELVLLYPTLVKFKHATYPDLNIKPLLQSLLSQLRESQLSYHTQPRQSMVIPKLELPSTHSLRQEWVWNQISQWFQEHDVIITETGTSAFGINQTNFPHHTLGISQALWGSVGYSLGACLGAAMAATELSKTHRVVLFIGDGAFQLTAQELSTMIRWRLTPYIFIMNNQGYSVDRFLHSNASYYDIQPWDYSRLPEIFGAQDYESRKIVTVGDFQSMVKDPNFANAERIRILEIMLPPMDVPQALRERWVQEEKRELERRESVESVKRQKLLPPR
ncbi:THI3 (YDL080C) [Zygosaccharomyces parabailii]|nr:THI3 (YDL080C) [Zygosaccharomyces parabailii]CDH13094.1 probable Thiamine metabolism regulatory protein THI3 [Zygosaccharomyces bailii ISA1307]